MHCAFRPTPVPLLACGLAVACAWVTTAGSAQPAGRQLVVIADLHLGVGKNPQTGDWHPYEEFRWPDHFRAFLDATDTQGNGATDLIVNGDAFELWQGIGDECPYAGERPGCSEAEALVRLERVIGQHAAELQALGRFAAGGDNRVTFVPGDHDAALLWPALANRLIAAIGAPGRVEVASTGYWVSPDANVFVEHGHQIGFEPNRFTAWPAPFVQIEGRPHLERTRGERLTQPLINQYEQRLEIIDNVSQDGLGLKYVLSAEASESVDTGGLLRIFLSKQSWLQFRSDLETEREPPVWDVEAVRRSGAAFLVDSLEPDDPIRAVAARAQQSGRLGASASDLSDEEIVAICDYRAAVRRARRRNEQGLTQLVRSGPVVRECPRQRDATGAGFQYFWGSRDRIFSHHLSARAERLRKTGASGPIELFIYSHTHLGHRAFVPAPVGTRPLVVNTGSWQRSVFPATLERLKEERRLSNAAVLAQLRLDDLPVCYSFVTVPRTTGPRGASVRYWRYAGGSWSMVAPARAGGCEERE